MKEAGRGTLKMQHTRGKGDPEIGHQTCTIKKCVLKLRRLGRGFSPVLILGVAVEDKKPGSHSWSEKEDCITSKDPSHETGSSNWMRLWLISQLQKT